MAKSPEWSVIKSHIADINGRIPIPDISSYASDLLQAGLIGQAGHDNALATMGTGPAIKIASLTSEAMGKIKVKPHLFNALVDIIEERSEDEAFASKLRKEYQDKKPGARKGSSPGVTGAGVTGGRVTGATAMDRPITTIDQLISLKKADGTTLKVIKWISSLEQWQCSDFAQMLLKDAVQVTKIKKNCKDSDDKFVREILYYWLTLDDDDPAVARTWSALAQCVTDAGLPGKLAKDIRDTFPSDSSSTPHDTKSQHFPPLAAESHSVPAADSDTVLHKLKKHKFPEHKWRNLAIGLMLGGCVDGIESEKSTNLSRLIALVNHWTANVDESGRWKTLVDAVIMCEEYIVAKSLAKDVGVPFQPPEQ